MSRRRFRAKPRRDFLGGLTTEAFWTLYLLFLAALFCLCVKVINAADARILERLGH